MPLLAVSKAGRLTPEGIADLRGAFDLGPTRTLQQDVEFGVLQIVDIALKAISPAVNDPSTAINCVDQLSRHPDPLRLARAAGSDALRSAGHGAGRHSLDRLRPAAGSGL